ncbi:DNA-binding transcriptional regulator, LysR family [Ferrimonas sediminum]|uniref:DNA-binding transcriptional regulator, LysR family n=1 Tax=Ferrimonas sediminum TaxID=718193 RepID=A0A1G8P3F7_9GAMM|nr:LysR family transcriptional regulator [Ferrimonas sediminum]SDI86370.1 DNA-binding transcriptional regulator, LysR family [Ferrimonas sediminum]
MNTDDLALFIAVIEYGSQSEAARVLGIPVSKVCRRIALLEEKLGSRLLERTTRSLALTEAGEALVERANVILAEVDTLELTVGRLQDEPEGDVVIAAPIDFVNKLMVPSLRQFHDQYPKLKLKFISYQSRQNPMDIQADITVFISQFSPPDSSLVGRKLASFQRGFLASPEFIAAHPQLTHPRQLVDYPCLMSPKGVKPGNLWMWNDGSSNHCIEVDGPIESENNGLCISAAVEGMGVVWAPLVMCMEEMRSGRLLPLFDGQYCCEVNTWGLYSYRRFLSHKVTLALDFVHREYERLQRQIEQMVDQGIVAEGQGKRTPPES